MIVLFLILIGPFILGARLLGADWELAIFVGLVFYPALFALIMGGALVLDGIESARRRRRIKKRGMR